MKHSVIIPLVTCALAGLLLSGCASSPPIPQAKRYDVKVGNTIYQVDRVIIHGDWIEMRTDKTISQWVYAAGVVITPKTD